MAWGLMDKKYIFTGVDKARERALSLAVTLLESPAGAAVPVVPPPAAQVDALAKSIMCASEAWSGAKEKYGPGGVGDRLSGWYVGVKDFLPFPSAQLSLEARNK